MSKEHRTFEEWYPSEPKVMPAHLRVVAEMGWHARDAELSAILGQFEALAEKWRNDAQAQEVESCVIEDKMRRGVMVAITATVGGKYVAPGRKLAKELSSLIASVKKERGLL